MAGIGLIGGGMTTANTDTNDLSNMFNTQLTPDQEQQFRSWASANGRLSDSYDYDMRGAWLNGASRGANGHFPDTYKKPNHPTFSTESKYSGVGGNVGGAWTQSGQNAWMFTPSPTNLQHTDPSDLKAYFNRVEPTSILNFIQQGK